MGSCQMRSAFLGPTILVKDYVHEPNSGYRLLTRDTYIMMKAPPSTCASPKEREFGESKFIKTMNGQQMQTKPLKGWLQRRFGGSSLPGRGPAERRSGSSDCSQQMKSPRVLGWAGQAVVFDSFNRNLLVIH